MVHDKNKLDSLVKTVRIQSSQKDDPVVGPLLEGFLSNLNERQRAMSAAFHAKNLDAVQKIAHQVMGSCSVYGFESLSLAAKKIETVVQQQLPANQVLRALADFEDMIAAASLT